MYDLACELGFDPPKNLEGWGVIKPAPWIDEKMRDKIRMILYYLFPYANDRYEEKHSKKFRLVQKTFHHLARWRWKHRFFGFLLDYKLYRAYTSLRTMATGESATEHD